MGEFKHTMDSKGRIIIPSKIREEMGETFILTRGLDGCLFGYPKDKWSALTDKLENQLSLGKKDARAVTRFFYASASEVEFDKQGRIMVPANLREYASLNKVCRVIGVLDRIEIWDEDYWQNYLNDTEENISEVAENIFEF